MLAHTLAATATSDANAKALLQFAELTMKSTLNLNAKVTVLTVGTRGSLTRDVVRHLKLDAGKNPKDPPPGVNGTPLPSP